MSAPTVNVTVRLNNQNGEPVAGAMVEAKLTTTERYNGYVVPATTTANTDDTGTAVLQLFPNELGSEGSEYQFKIVDATTGKTVKVYAVVPDNDCELSSITDLEPYDRVGAGEIITSEITVLKNQSESAASASASSAATASEQAGIATTKAEEAIIAASSAYESSLVATSQAEISTTKAEEAAQSAAVAASSAEALPAHTGNTENPHNVTKTQVGLSNVDNTSDTDKPISEATQSALNEKADASALTTHTGNTENPHNVTKTQVGLSNVDNTSDTDKPISEATQSALNEKADASALTTHTGNTENPHNVTASQVGAYTKGEADDLLSSKSNTNHTHTGTYAPVSHNHDTAYLGLTAKASDSSKLEGMRAGQNGTNYVPYVDSAGNFAIGLTTALSKCHVHGGRILSTTDYGANSGLLGVYIGQNASLNVDIDFRRWTGSATQHSTARFELDDLGNMHIYQSIENTNIASNAKKWSFLESGALVPAVDAVANIGSAVARINNYYGANGAIVTSDARLKTEVLPLSAIEIAAAVDISNAIGTYQFLAAIDEKGLDGARKHIGLTVQKVIEIMESHGLDPFRYGFICYDKWDEETIDHYAVDAKDAVPAQPAEYRSVVTHEDIILDGVPSRIERKNIICSKDAVEAQPAVEAKEAWTEVVRTAGDRYGLRYDEINMFILRGLSAKLTGALA